MNPPRIFISYSHDSDDHKEWVLSFATMLRQQGVDVVLDQWDLKPGDDLPHFMETQLETADYVLMICTKKYVEKSNAGIGGVGYEKMIMTSSFLSKIDNRKVIPIIRQNGTDERPTFLKSKLYIDFSNDIDFKDNLEKLLRHLLNAPLYKKPNIGSSPFKLLKESKPEQRISNILNNNPREIKNLRGMFKDAGIDEKYLSSAIKNGLIKEYLGGRSLVTNEGLEYLIHHGIIEA